MAGDQKLPIRRVDPVEARKGTFLKTFAIGEMKEMLAYCGQTRIAMARHDVHGELVFTRMNRWGKQGDSWQVFLLP